MGALPGSRIRLSALALLALSVFALSSIAPVFAFAKGENASTVIGQSSFTTGASALTSTGLNLPAKAIPDSSGNLWVVDFNNNRVLKYPTPFTNGEAATVVIGQTSFTANIFATTQGGLNEPIAAAFDGSGNLWVVDRGNARLLEYTPPFTTGELASVVIGQPTFTSNTLFPPSSTSLFEPRAIAFDHLGDLWVSDWGNNRVLEFVPPFFTFEGASVVIGQTDFTSTAAADTQSGLGDPFGLAVDASNNLYVADGWNRIMVFDSPQVTGELATIVLGQTSFTTHVSGTSQSLFMDVEDVAIGPSGNLWVADSGNDRILMFRAPFKTGELAALVLGQSDFVSNGFATTQSGLFDPWSVAFGPGNAVWVGDTENNRVLRFPAKLPTSTTVSCSPNPVALAAPTTCTATVTDTGGGVAATPTGTVTFSTSFSGTFSSATCTLSGSGGTSTCSVQFTPSATGTALITATYAATPTFAASKGKTSVMVT